MIEDAVVTLLDAVSYHGLAHRLELLKYLSVFERVYPFLDEEERESAQPLWEIWALKKIEFEKRENVEKKKEWDRIVKNNRWGARTNEHAAREKHEHIRTKMIWGDPPAHGRPELPEAEKLEEDEKLEEILGILEGPLPWSAWALHESPQERVAAAARYIGTFQYSKHKAIKEEVLLLDARRTAMELLVEGGRINEEVARFFLEAYEGRKQEEEDGKSLSNGAKAQSSSVGLGEGSSRAMEAALEDREDELDDHAFDLSDPEGFDEEQDDSEEDAADETDSESEVEVEDVKAGSGERRK